MKRLLFVVLLTFCLSFPAFAGHVLPGMWCECGSSAACICDPGEQPNGQSNRSVSDDSKQDAPINLGSETLLLLGVLLLLLRYKA